MTYLASRLFGTPLLIHRPKLDVILSVVGQRIGMAADRVESDARLIVQVVRTQQYRVALQLHPFKNGTVTRKTGRALKAVTSLVHIHPQSGERHTKLLALGFAMQFPIIGLGLKTMIHMHSVQMDIQGRKRMKQHRGIHAARIRHNETGRR